MADSITLINDNGRGNRTGVDPSNSGTTPSTSRKRAYIVGPPTNGAPNAIGRWAVQAWGTQTNSNSATAATYAHVANEPYYTIAPTSFSYVSLDSLPGRSNA